MSPTSEPQNPAPAPAVPAGDAPKSAPVMDVSPPNKNDKPAEVDHAPAPEPTADTPKDPPAEANDETPDKLIEDEAPQPKPTTPKPPKQPASGVTTAIVATVIIVIVLAGLATYAYMQTK